MSVRADQRVTAVAERSPVCVSDVCCCAHRRAAALPASPVVSAVGASKRPTVRDPPGGSTDRGGGRAAPCRRAFLTAAEGILWCPAQSSNLNAGMDVSRRWGRTAAPSAMPAFRSHEFAAGPPQFQRVGPRVRRPGSAARAHGPGRRGCTRRGHSEPPTRGAAVEGEPVRGHRPRRRHHGTGWRAPGPSDVGDEQSHGLRESDGAAGPDGLLKSDLALSRKGAPDGCRS